MIGYLNFTYKAGVTHYWNRGEFAYFHVCLMSSLCPHSDGIMVWSFIVLSTIVTEWPCLIIVTLWKLSSVGEHYCQLLAASYRLSWTFFYFLNQLINPGFRLVLTFPHRTLWTPGDEVWPKLWERNTPCFCIVATQHLKSFLFSKCCRPEGSILSGAGVKGERELLPSSGVPSHYTSDCTQAHRVTPGRLPGISQGRRGGQICPGTRSRRISDITVNVTLSVLSAWWNLEKYGLHELQVFNENIFYNQRKYV